MAEEITVQLFPPTPAGVQVANTPNGMLPISTPMYEYGNCTDVSFDLERRLIQFTNRRKERIESNLPFIVKREYKSEGEA